MSKIIYLVGDVESDAAAPGVVSKNYDFGQTLGSMFEFAVVDLETDRSFYGQLKPISEYYEEDRLTACGRTREETMLFPQAQKTMNDFVRWLESFGGSKIKYYSDNNGYDWMFMCWYLITFTEHNPMGHNSHNIADLYQTVHKKGPLSFVHLKTQPHTHHPLDDARGNAGALRKMIEMGLIL